MSGTESHEAPAGLDRVARGLAVKRAFLVALVVGTLLTLINQPDAIFGDAEFGYFRALLTYIVPFCVSIYGAATALKAR